ncbi:TMEM175 family protein [Propionibacterium sp.]|uniref:TMEM175 family protein n=1 Tax=Propionibacterium sp. TaxID=1977903 RepID=UPI0039E9D26A
MTDPDTTSREFPVPVERVITFVDAAVAIALTLLILPLMEELTGPAESPMSTADFLAHNSDALIAFAISFVVIANFWLGHHRLYQHIAWEFPGLFWTNMAWLMTIVFLPVATAMTIRVTTDRLQYVVYIGTMILTCLVQAVMTWLAGHHPESWREGHEVQLRAVSDSISLAIGFVVAMAGSVTIPHVGYWSMFVLFAIRPLRSLVNRSSRPPGQRAGRAQPPRQP